MRFARPTAQHTAAAARLPAPFRRKIPGSTAAARARNRRKAVRCSTSKCSSAQRSQSARTSRTRSCPSAGMPAHWNGSSGNGAVSRSSSALRPPTARSRLSSTIAAMSASSSSPSSSCQLLSRSSRARAAAPWGRGERIRRWYSGAHWSTAARTSSVSAGRRPTWSWQNAMNRRRRAGALARYRGSATTLRGIQSVSRISTRTSLHRSGSRDPQPAAYQVMSSSSPCSSSPSTSSAYGDPKNSSRSAASSSSLHSRVGRTCPPLGSFRSTHSTSGRAAGQESVCGWGRVRAPQSIARSTSARATAGSRSATVVSGSSIFSRTTVCTASRESGMTNASFTIPPMLWST